METKLVIAGVEGEPGILNLMTTGELYLMTSDALTPPNPLTQLVACPLPSRTTAT